eukprot:3020589-Amphidinium_carterae.1
MQQVMKILGLRKPSKNPLVSGISGEPMLQQKQLRLQAESSDSIPPRKPQKTLKGLAHPNISNLLHEGIALHQSTPGRCVHVDTYFGRDLSHKKTVSLLDVVVYFLHDVLARPANWRDA